MIRCFHFVSQSENVEDKLPNALFKSANSASFDTWPEQFSTGFFPASFTRARIARVTATFETATFQRNIYAPETLQYLSFQQKLDYYTRIIQ